MVETGKVHPRLPQVDKILRHTALEALALEFRRDFVAEITRQVLSRLRESARPGEVVPGDDEIAGLISEEVRSLAGGSLRRVINGTGVVLNTNLGRAPLSESALARVAELGAGYTNLEIDLESGKRGKRSARLSRLLSLLTGCEAAIVVNNNAAAVLLCVNCFARGKEVIVSRGELVEIGGSFRVPDVIEASGARLKEVGTTNRTRIADYKKAIGPETGLLMRCHRSNFEVLGFTEDASLEELVVLSSQSGVPLVEDLGSGVLLPLEKFGLPAEPTVQSVIGKGCGLVTFSGDKLLGGPQAGIICGRKSEVDKLASHPLYRALRPDKLTISLLEMTLLSYLKANPESELPSLSMMASDYPEIARRVEKFIEGAGGKLRCIELAGVDCHSLVGGGSLPGQGKPSRALWLKVAHASSSHLAKLLRKASCPVVAVTQDEQLRIDFRTVLPAEEPILSDVLQAVDNCLSDNDPNNAG